MSCHCCPRHPCPYCGNGYWWWNRWYQYPLPAVPYIPPVPQPVVSPGRVGDAIRKARDLLT